MSGQNAERSGEFTSTDSRLDAILEQLNALGGSAPTPNTPPAALRSVPDLPSEPTESVLDGGEPAERPDPPESVSNLDLVPPPLEPPPRETPPVEKTVIDPVPLAAVADDSDQLDLVIEPPETVTIAPPAEPAPFETQTQDQHEPPQQYSAPEQVEAPQPVEAPQRPDLLDEDIDTTVFTLPPQLPTVTPDTADHDTAWVSHHEDKEQPDGDQGQSESVEPPVEAQVGVFDGRTPDVEIESLTEDESAFGAPDWADVQEDDPLEDIPDSLGVQDGPTLGGTDMFEHIDSAATPAPEFELEPPIEIADSSVHGPLYESDEDLPLPDFTGVWSEDGDETVWGQDAAQMSSQAIPEPVETGREGSGISVGRNELDSLRPTEEVAIVKEPQHLGRKLQLMGVVLFGLIALAVIFLDDPAVIDELRDLYDNFFG